jgi:hypothetical protein
MLFQSIVDRVHVLSSSSIEIFNESLIEHVINIDMNIHKRARRKANNSMNTTSTLLSIICISKCLSTTYVLLDRANNVYSSDLFLHVSSQMCHWPMNVNTYEPLTISWMYIESIDSCSISQHTFRRCSRQTNLFTMNKRDRNRFNHRCMLPGSSVIVTRCVAFLASDKHFMTWLGVIVCVFDTIDWVYFRCSSLPCCLFL